MISRYHSQVGRQGRAGAGYQGMRYDQPLSTFVSRPMMEPEDDLAEPVAQKTLEGSMTPLDVVKSLLVDQQNVNDPDSGEQDASVSQGPVGQSPMGYGIGRGLNIGINDVAKSTATNIAKSALLDAPFSMNPFSMAVNMGVPAAKGMIAANKAEEAYGTPLADVMSDPAYSEWGTPPPPNSLTPQQEKAFHAVNQVKNQMNPMIDKSIPSQVYSKVIKNEENTIFDPIKKDPQVYRALMEYGGVPDIGVDPGMMSTDDPEANSGWGMSLSPENAPMAMSIDTNDPSNIGMSMGTSDANPGSVSGGPDGTSGLGDAGVAGMSPGDAGLGGPGAGGIGGIGAVGPGEGGGGGGTGVGGVGW